MEETVADMLEKFLDESVLVSEMEKLAKSYPRVEHVPSMKVPRLDQEVFQALDINVRQADQSWQAVQKSVLGAMAAFESVMELAFKRSKQHAELNALDKNLMDGLNLLGYVHDTLKNQRREAIRPSLSLVYAKALTKSREKSPDWLYGGNLNDTAKRLER